MYAAFSRILFTVTVGHFSPNVLMISAVCGRAPPRECAANIPPVPPAAPSISQDWLSVMKTLGLSIEVSVVEAVWALARDAIATTQTDAISFPSIGGSFQG